MKYHGASIWGAGIPRRVTGDEYWKQLGRWNRKAIKAGEHRRVFCASQADVFDEAAPVAAQWRLWREIEQCPQLEFLLLTKRPEQWRAHIPMHWRKSWPQNVRLGFTAEDQQRWDERYEIAAEFRMQCESEAILPFFVSCEPLLGLIDFHRTTGLVPPGIGWVIAGGETDGGQGKARAMRLEWAREIRDQCKASGVPFFFKQWGEWAPTGDPGIYGAAGYAQLQGMNYVGKKAAGCLLDGVEYHEFPQFA